MGTQTVTEWLESDEGLQWARSHFEDATDCHDLIEIHDDSPQYETEDKNLTGWWSDSTARATEIHFKWLRSQNPEWRRLRWTPDHPPEGGRPCKGTSSSRGASSRSS